MCACSVIEVGSDRFKVPELLFNPAGILPGVPRSEALGLDGGAPLAGVAQLVLDSVNKCDVDIRRELFNTILVSAVPRPLPRTSCVTRG